MMSKQKLCYEALCDRYFYADDIKLISEIHELNEKIRERSYVKFEDYIDIINDNLPDDQKIKVYQPFETATFEIDDEEFRKKYSRFLPLRHPPQGYDPHPGVCSIWLRPVRG